MTLTPPGRERARARDNRRTEGRALDQGSLSTSSLPRLKRRVARVLFSSAPPVCLLCARRPFLLSLLLHRVQVVVSLCSHYTNDPGSRYRDPPLQARPKLTCPAFT